MKRVHSGSEDEPTHSGISLLLLLALAYIFLRPLPKFSIPVLLSIQIQK